MSNSENNSCVSTSANETVDVILYDTDNNCVKLTISKEQDEFLSYLLCGGWMPKVNIIYCKDIEHYYMTEVN